MVKIAKKSAQDPTDSSLQMKVYTLSFRSDNTSFSVEEIPPQLILILLYLLLEFSLRIQLLPSLSSGIT